jgi:hypothetical protein
VYERPTDNRERRWAPVPVKCPKDSKPYKLPMSLTAKRKVEERLKAEIEKHKNDLDYSNVTMKDTGVMQTIVFAGLCLSLMVGALIVLNTSWPDYLLGDRIRVCALKPEIWVAALIMQVCGNLFLAFALILIISDKRDLLLYCVTLLVLVLFAVLQILALVYSHIAVMLVETVITVVYLLYIGFFYRSRFGALAAIDVFSVWFSLLMCFNFVA